MKEQLQTVDDLLSKGEVKKAEIIVARLLRSDLSPQEQVQVLVYRAKIRLLSARPEDALDDLQNISQLSPETVQTAALMELRADCYFARFELATVGFALRNDIASAEQIYRDIIEKHPNYANLGWIYYQLGRIKVTANEMEQAVECFQKSLYSPSHVPSLTSYCYERLGFIAYYEQRDLEKALSFLNRAISTYPSSEKRNWLVDVHLLRSRVFKGMQNYEGSWKAVEEALTVVLNDSSDNKAELSEVLLVAGEILSEIGGRDKEVIAYLQQFIQRSKKPLGVDVTWSRANEMLGNAYFNAGLYDNAISAYAAALQFNPDHPWGLSLHYRIARSYYQQKDYQQVVTTIQHLLEMAEAEHQSIDDYHIYDTLGNALFALKKYDRARSAYQNALDIAPANADLEKIKSYHDLARELI